VCADEPVYHARLTGFPQGEHPMDPSTTHTHAPAHPPAHTMVDIADLAQALCDQLILTLGRAEARLLEEHAPLGLDALDETAIHPILAGGLADAGWGVHRETPYPGDHETADSARDRCDIVLTARPGVPLLDPVHADRRVRAGENTLFAAMATEMESDAAAEATDPADAVWLEVKAVAQHAYRDGVPGPNRAYASEMVNGPAADVCKLLGDGVIERALACLVLFTETEEIARHDTERVAHRLLDDGLPIGLPAIATAPIADRAGNACVTLAVFPIRGLGLGPIDHDPDAIDAEAGGDPAPF
jgi:hypothetical protein